MIFVQDDQLSLAIGKKGQNVRLASKLIGWQLDVRSVNQKIPIASLEGVGAKTEGLLKEAGINTLKDILKSSAEDLMKIPGIGPKTAEKIIASAHKAILEKDKKSAQERVQKAEKVIEEKLGQVAAEEQAQKSEGQE